MKAELQAQLDRALHSLTAGQPQAADAIYAHLLLQWPSLVVALHMRGVAQYQLRNYPAALQLLTEAVQRDPGDAAIHSNLGMVHRALQAHERALQAYDEALRLQPEFAQAWTNRANVLRDLGRPKDAVGSYRQALALQPHSASAWHGMGLAFTDQGLHEEALAAFDQAIAISPDYVTAYLDRGNACRDLQRLQDALDSYDAAIRIQPTYAQAWSNRGVVLKVLRQEALASASYEKALELKPDFLEAMVNYSTLLKETLQLDDSARMAEKALALDPQNAGAYLNLAIVHLLRGDLQAGFAHYEWRWKTDQLAGGQRNFKEPLWLGQCGVGGATVLLHAEQGLGDTLQFCRYVPQLAQCGAKVVLEVQKPLVGLLQQLPGVQQVVAQGDPLATFDLHCPLLSLPLALGTTLQSIPPPTPLHASPSVQAHWQKRLAQHRQQRSQQHSAKRIGLVWSGRPQHKNDHNRSLPLVALAELVTDRFEFHCLQQEVRPADLAALARRADIAVWSEGLTDFSQTAGLIAGMDLVISVDTSVAHLAASMGKPVWLLLPYSPDWRWLLEREDSPWYPTMRLFRQESTNDWEGVVSRLRAALDMLTV